MVYPEITLPPFAGAVQLTVNPEELIDPADTLVGSLGFTFRVVTVNVEL